MSIPLYTTTILYSYVVPTARFTHLTNVFDLLHSSMFGVQFFPCFRWEKVSVAAQRGMLPDIKVAKKSIKLVAGTQVVVVLKNVQRQALAEVAGTDEEVVQKRFIRRF